MAESVPPSIALILLGSATAMSTGALFIAGVLPAATIGLMLMLTVRVRATFARWRPEPRARRQEVVRSGRRAILPLLIPVILIGGIIGGLGTPTEVSTFAVIYSLALGIIDRKINVRSFWSCLTGASVLNGMIFYTVSAATIFSWALTLEGVTTAIASTIAGFGHAAFLPAVIGITILMGTMLESFVTIIILAPLLLLPVALQLGIDPLQYGIVMTEAFGIGIDPAADRDRALRCVCDQRRPGRARDQAAALVPARAARGADPGDARAGYHNRSAEAAQLQILTVTQGVNAWTSPHLPTALLNRRRMRREGDVSARGRCRGRCRGVSRTFVPAGACPGHQAHSLRAPGAHRARLAHLGGAVQEVDRGEDRRQGNSARSSPTPRWVT